MDEARILTDSSFPTTQIQRQAEALAQDPYRHLNQQPLVPVRHLVLFRQSKSFCLSRERKEAREKNEGNAMKKNVPFALHPFYRYRISSPVRLSCSMLVLILNRSPRLPALVDARTIACFRTCLERYAVFFRLMGGDQGASAVLQWYG